jgi:hypothetical protein
VSGTLNHNFTPEEANRTLPVVKGLVSEIVQLKKKLEYSSGIERRQDLDRLSVLITKLEETGAEMKDLDMGLIDFPATRFNEPVYLCWKPGEETVLYWHGMTEGFRGRKPLKPAEAKVP